MAAFFNFTKEGIGKARYSNGRTALIAQNNEGEVLAKLTVNIPAQQLESDEVLIKDYSENEGVLDDLIKMGAVRVVRSFQYGFAMVHVCKLLI